ncbi:MAG TPA: HIT family protein [Alphaproteobacteria bacterium]|nr:HIT family protein [Alphaproteobacteria bacterium]
MASDPNCIFCKIVAGTIPCFKLHEDSASLAFLDINPVSPGHALVIPKAHAPTLFDSVDVDLAAAIATARRVATAIDKVLQPAGLNLLQANGPGAGQSVFHLHLHVIPRAVGDGIRMTWEPKPGDMAELAKLAERIRGAF